MTNEIIRIEPSLPLSFEEFKARVRESDSAKSAFDKTAEFYDRIPLFIRVLQNFDRTGLASAIDQILTEKQAESEQDNILRAIHALYQALCWHSQELLRLEQSYLSQQGPMLTYSYFEHCKRTFHPSKIELFRNVWFNGLVNVDRRPGEKSRMFDLVASLTEEDIFTLRIIYDRQHSLASSDREPVHIDDIGAALNVESAYAQQICVNLQARGLLFDSGIGKWGYKGPVRFVITDYAKLLVEYITEPSSAGNSA